MQDMRGQDLTVGDTIAYPFISGNMPYLRIGKIVEFVQKQDWRDQWIEKMRVEWTEGRGTNRQGKMISLVEFGNRALKL